MDKLKFELFGKLGKHNVLPKILWSLDFVDFGGMIGDRSGNERYGLELREWEMGMIRSFWLGVL